MKKERLNEIKTVKEAKKAELKEKPFSKLTAKEKDALLETVAKMLGLIRGERGTWSGYPQS